MSVRQQGKKPHPWDSAGIFSRNIFSWTHPAFKLGWSKELNEEDLDDCPVSEGSQVLGNILNREWQKEVELQKTRKKDKASLRLVVLRAFGTSYLLQSLGVLIIECGVRVMQPVCLGWLIRYYSASPKVMTDTEGYLSAAGVCLLGLIQVLFYHSIVLGLVIPGMRVRIASCTLIYRKALKLSQKAMGKTTIGQMVNLLSNDVNRFDMAVMFLPFIIIGPLQTVVVMGVLWPHLGVSCLFGLLVLLLFIPFQSVMGTLFSKLRSKTAILTDERVRLMNEIVAGMRVIKMYTWEHPFAKMVGLSRKKEVAQIRKTSMLRGFNIAVFFGASKIIVFVCFVAFLLLGNRTLTAEAVFVSISLYNNLRLAMTFFFPLAITCWAECTISLSRIQDFLEHEEKDDASTVDKVEQVETKDSGVWLNAVSANWDEQSEEISLKDITMSVASGELWAIVGSVGAGKSSLLMTILGELPTTSGDIKIRGKVAYSSQDPWVFSGTIQQNVLFGMPMNNEKYQNVLRVCALHRDIDILPYGDQTMVGERGVSLSGGQKARVNLARAIYMDADVYLMDDPLSAVDVSVAKHLFDECINGHLKNKARILVTHQVQFLKSAHRIIVLKHGKIDAIGDYDELVEKGYDLLAIVDDKAIKASKKANEVKSSDKHESLKHTTGPEADKAEETSSYSGSTTSLDSLVSKSSNKDTNEDEPPKQADEEKSEGSVKASTYFIYLKAGGGILLLLFVIVANLLTQLIYSYSDFWLALWTTAEQERNGTDYNSTSGTTWESVWDTITGDFTDTNTNIYTYTGLMVALFVLSITRTVAFFLICMNSSVVLHDRMFKSVSRAPIAFFDRNPVGRILNRFTKDLGLIDDLLPFTFVDFTANILTLLGILVIVIYVSYYVAIPAVILMIVFVYVRRYYIATAVDLKRLEGTTRSPVFSHLSTSLYGLTTIRASGVQEQFENDFCSVQDHHTSPFFTILGIGRWFARNLDFLTVVFITCLTIFLMTVDSGTTGGNIGLSISSALALTGLFQYSVNQSADLENQMTAVERVLEYSRLTPEAELESSPQKKPPSYWPKEGEIMMKNLRLTYPDSGDVPVLKGLNCQIKGGEKIGIVGRTGAGKSSIVSALFRMTEPSGLLTIDGVNVKEIGLHDLRSKISIIPQDPVLFGGPVRSNIDPFNQKSDQELWNVLEEVQLKQAVVEMSGGLDNKISEGGGNLSVGQRQLICLARALLRRNKILVLDEATANVDHKTDALIQTTIRDKFGHCTVITIAHRLNTIMDSDKIMVLDHGEIVEFDEPLKLLERETSQLSSMIKQTGPVMSKKLYDIAKNAKITKDTGHS